MTKQAVVISYKDRPIAVCDIKMFRSYEDFNLTTKTAEKNLESLLSMIQNDRELLKRKIANLEERCKVLEAQAKYDHGEITEQEYNELCGLNN